MERQTRMSIRSVSGVILISIAFASCGSDGSVSAPAVTDTATSEPDQPLDSVEAATTPPPAEASVSVDRLAGRWYPVAVDGVALDASEGEYWTFDGTAARLEIDGYDGCNHFFTSESPIRPSVSLVDGRLENVEIASDEMACDGVEYGPYPETGAQLTVSDDGTALTSAGPSATIELSRIAPAADAPEPDDTEQPPPDSVLGTFELSPPNPQAGETFAATFDPENVRGGYFTLEQWSGSEWLSPAFVLESDANGGPPTWATIDGEFATLDYAVGGAGPDGLVMPDDIETGLWDCAPPMHSTMRALS